ncbi:hypothetical protein [Streptomyces melanogenes]
MTRLLPSLAAFVIPVREYASLPSTEPGRELGDRVTAARVS